MSRKILSGVVVSTKMDKTAVVVVETTKKHKLYGKRYLSHKKYKVQDEKNSLNEGDKVLIESSKPLSKTKNWIVKEKVSK